MKYEKTDVNLDLRNNRPLGCLVTFHCLNFVYIFRVREGKKYPLIRRPVQQNDSLSRGQRTMARPSLLGIQVRAQYKVHRGIFSSNTGSDLFATLGFTTHQILT